MYTLQNAQLGIRTGVYAKKSQIILGKFFASIQTYKG